MRPVDLTGRPLGICKVATRYRVNPCPAPSFFPPIFFLLSTSFPPRPGQVSTAIFATKTATSARNKLNCDSREGTDGKGGRSLDHFAARTAGKKCIVSLSRPRLSTRKRVSLGLYSWSRQNDSKHDVVAREEWKNIDHLKLLSEKPRCRFYSTFFFPKDTV